MNEYSFFNCKLKACVILLSLVFNSFVIAQKSKYVLVIHGGAGTILKSNMTIEKEKMYKKALEEALMIGYEKFKQGKSSVDIVESAVKFLEDCPLFNAGKGAVFTQEGINELDASIMDGKTLKAGSVAGLTIIKNPIELARAVMDKSEHVMMVCRGAENFAKSIGFDTVPNSYFFTQGRWDDFQKGFESESKAKESSFNDVLKIDGKFGTVGAVALDKQSNLAAATSTGGMTNKKYGRVGDSPIIGAGTYANNNVVAVSCTGWGEYFIRSVAAYDVAALMQYKNIDVDKATDLVISKIDNLKGSGGIIALDKNGNIGISFNTEGMYRAYITEDGVISINIYK